MISSRLSTDLAQQLVSVERLVLALADSHHAKLIVHLATTLGVFVYETHDRNLVR